MSRILVIQLRMLGDMLQTTPMIRQLSRLYPDSPIDLVCEPRSDVVVRHNPYIAEIFHFTRKIGVRRYLDLAYQLRQRRYAMVVDGQALPKTALLTRLTGAPRRLGFRRRFRGRLFYTHPFCLTEPIAEYSAITRLRLLQDDRVDWSDLALDFPVGPEDQAMADWFCATHVDGPVAAISAVSHRVDNHWPVAKWARIADRLAARGLKPLLLFGPGEQPGALAVAAAMRSPAVVDYPMLTFPALKAVLERCTLFVGSDGGPRHVAVAAGLPSVALFGTVHPEVWTAPGRADQRFVATHSDVRSIPTTGRCTLARTLADIPVESVWKAVEALLQETPARFGRDSAGIRPRGELPTPVPRRDLASWR